MPVDARRLSVINVIFSLDEQLIWLDSTDFLYDLPIVSWYATEDDV